MITTCSPLTSNWGKYRVHCHIPLPSGFSMTLGTVDIVDAVPLGTGLPTAGGIFLLFGDFRVHSSTTSLSARFHCLSKATRVAWRSPLIPFSFLVVTFILSLPSTHSFKAPNGPLTFSILVNTFFFRLIFLVGIKSLYCAKRARFFSSNSFSSSSFSLSFFFFPLFNNTSIPNG